MKSVFIIKEDLNEWIAKYFPKQDLISIENLLGVIEELDDQVKDLEEKYSDLERDLQDNYRPIPYAEQVE